MASTFPPRLHVLLARDAKRAVVLRRGPSSTFCAIGWDRTTDRFTVGQWVRARIYERRSDLSPDGTHLLYFAMNGRWRSETKGSWTAISRAPYLNAVTLYAKGDCWHGGGLFVDDRSYWLNDGYGHELLEDTGEVTRASPPPYQPRWGGECPGVYYNRLQRDGWTMRGRLRTGTRDRTTDVFVKPLSHGWTLRKLAHAMIDAPPGKGVYFDEHELVGHGKELPRHDWEWCDLVDQAADRIGGRLVWSTGGKLHAGHISKQSSRLDDPIQRPRELFDANGMTFAAIPAPYAHGKRRRDREARKARRDADQRARRSKRKKR